MYMCMIATSFKIGMVPKYLGASTACCKLRPDVFDELLKELIPKGIFVVVVVIVVLLDFVVILWPISA